MTSLINTLAFYGITGGKLYVYLALFLVIVTFFIVASIYLIFKLLQNYFRQKNHNNLVVLQVLMPKFSAEQEDGNQAPRSQQELAERIAPAEAFFNSIAGLQAQKGLKALFFGRNDYYSFEIVYKDGLIYFYVVCPQNMEQYIREQISSQFPDAHIEKTEDYNIFTPQGVILGAELKFKKEYIFPIKTYKSIETDTLNSITTAIGQLPEGTGAAIQFLTRSAHPQWHNWGQKTASKASQGVKVSQAIKEARSGFNLGSIWQAFKKPQTNQETNRPETYTLTQMEQEAVKGIEEKASKAGLEANIRIIISAPNQVIAQAGLDNILNSFSQFNIYQFGNAFVRSTPPKSKLIRNFIFREFNEKNLLILNSEEAASIFHFPLPHLDTPNILWMQSRKAPAPTNIPTSGMYLGDNIYRGKVTKVFIKPEDRIRHMYVIGMTGTGKSKFLDTLAATDIREGRGVCFIDPHGDDVDLILSTIPKERAEDIIYFDPSDTERPFGLNMLEYDYNRPEDKIFVVNQVFQIFDKLYDLKATGGPMFEQYMKNACMLIMDDPESGSTLMEVPRVLADEGYRNYKLSKCRTQVVKDFWEKEATKAGGEASLQNMVPYITSKLTPFIANDLIRPIIAQQKTTLDFMDAMNNGKIILVKLAKGKIGDINANLLGMIVIGKILQAAFARADIPEKERKDFFLYIDEFQNFLTDSINTILSEARKYRLGLIMAHQFLGQLVVNGDEKIKNSIFGNVGTKIAFRIGVEDAEFMAEEFKPVFNQYDLMNIPKFNCIMKLLIDNANPPPFNVKVPWFGDMFETNHELAEEYKKLSKLKYGKDKNLIEMEVQKRSSFGASAPKPAESKKGDLSLEDLFS